MKHDGIEVEPQLPLFEHAVVKILAKRGGVHLGDCRWNDSTRQYVFETQPNSLLSASCLTGISAQLEMLNDRRRRRPKKEKADGSIATGK